MADFPASPPFNNVLLANDDQLNTPAVPAGGVDEAAIGREALRAFKASALRLVSMESISEAELGMATYRLSLLDWPPCSKALHQGQIALLQRQEEMLEEIRAARTDYRILLVNSRIFARNQDAHVGTTTPFAPPAKFNPGFLIHMPHAAMVNIADVPADVALRLKEGLLCQDRTCFLLQFCHFHITAGVF
ncbi:hypothetical protein Ae201684P_008619 [Aphanomyces euteiches]|nr:hypothetical protein Ae201684P_008619 [Aphanomyces euteiches]